MRVFTSSRLGAVRLAAVAVLFVAVAGCQKDKTGGSVYVPASYSISGTVTGDVQGGVTVKLLGTSRSTTTLQDGTYTIAGLSNGTYTVEASRSGYAFFPGTRTAIVNGANVAAQDFTARLGIAIAGKVLGPVTGGVTVTLTGPSPATTTTTATTDADGDYAFVGVVAGTYTVTPSLAGGWTFTPTDSLVTIVASSVTGPNFRSIAPTHAISGKVTGAVTADVTVTLSGAADAVAATDASGNYSFTGLKAGTYSVTAAREGYVFAPSDRQVTVADADVTNQDFAAVRGHRIAGFVSGDVVADVPVALLDSAGTTSLASASTDANGYFEFSGLVDGAYVVAPSLDGLTFDPATRSVTLAGADVTNLTFRSATAPTFSVSGSVAGSVVGGVTMTLAGTAAGAPSFVAIVDALGAFTFTGVPVGDYMLIPANEDYVFTPASRLVSVIAADVVGQTFGAAVSPNARTITGTVAGAVAAGVTVTLTGPSSATTKTDADGAFVFRGLLDGQYTVVPSFAGYVFTPANCLVTIAGPSVTYVAFASDFAPHSIAGKVSGAVSANVVIALYVTGLDTPIATRLTGADGSYTFASLPNGDYRVEPSLTGYAFGPAAALVTLGGADVSGVDFVAVPVHGISGVVQNAGGNIVTMKLAGARETTVSTDALGAYLFTGLPDGTYFVTPSLEGYTFDPQSLPVALAGADATDVSFVATPIPTYTVSGTISGATGLTVTLTLSGTATGSVETGTGTYEFTGLGNGSYMVIPSLPGYTFTPASRAFHVNGANVTGQDFTAQ